MSGDRRNDARNVARSKAPELYRELTAPHHLFAIEPDVEIAADAVNVCFGNPVSSGVLGVRMTKGEVNAGNFFVL